MGASKAISKMRSMNVCGPGGLLFGIISASACGPVLQPAPAQAGTTQSDAASSSDSSSAVSTASTCSAQTSRSCECEDGRVGRETCDGVAFGRCLCNGQPDPDHPPPATSSSEPWPGTSSSTGSNTSSSSGDEPWTPTSTGLPPLGECPDVPNICTGPINVHSAEELAALSACTEIDGALSVDGYYEDLAGLRCITRVTGYLQIARVLAPDLSVLENLQEVDGQFDLMWNDQMTTLAMPRLESVGIMHVYAHDMLETLGLDALREMTTGIDARDNPNLSNCEFVALLEQLDHVGELVCYQFNAPNDECENSCPA